MLVSNVCTHWSESKSFEDVLQMLGNLCDKRIHLKNKSQIKT